MGLDHRLPARTAPVAWHIGWLGVAVFFVISGFIMRRADPSRFLWHRFRRIAPLYWLATAASILIGGRHYLFSEILRSVLLIPMQHDGSLQFTPILTQGWTLSLEVLFYLLFAALAARRAAITAALVGLVMISAVLPSGGLAGFYTQPIIIFFVIGLWIHRGRGGVSVAIVLLIVAAAYPGWPAALLTVAAVWCCTGESRAPRWLERAGDASYSTYLFHGFALAALHKAVGWLPPVAYVGVAVVACNLVGWALYRVVERPLIVGTERLSAISRRARLA